MRCPRLTSLVLIAITTIAQTSRACLWDYDTLRDEQRGLPGILEILSGRYEQHSRFFYEQRITRMNALLARDPHNLDAWDNLAVAYQKTGDTDQAIKTILKKDAIAPGQYTTYANLGTFEMLKGDLDGAIEHLQKALAINLNAHFGREEYQLKLARYLRDNRQHPEVSSHADFLGLGPLPEMLTPASATSSPTSAPSTEPATDPKFMDELEESYTGIWVSRESSDRLHRAGVKDNALDGIVGMLRYGPGGSAELYLALGDLLTLRGNANFAYRAYGRALEMKHPREQFIRAVMAGQRGRLEDPSDTAPDIIAAERANAEVWVKAYQDFEDGLVTSGVDAENPENFKPFYRVHGTANQDIGFRSKDYALNRRLLLRYPILIVPIVTFACVVAVYSLRWLKRVSGLKPLRRSAPPKDSNGISVAPI